MDSRVLYNLNPNDPNSTFRYKLFVCEEAHNHIKVYTSAVSSWVSADNKTATTNRMRITEYAFSLFYIIAYGLLRFGVPIILGPWGGAPVLRIKSCDIM